MRKVFADAGYWIALLNPRDRLHAAAVAIANEIPDMRIITSQVVLTEFLNHYGSFGQHIRRAATQVVDSLKQDPGVEIIPQDAAQFEAALELYRQRLDKGWGLSDCASFVIMQEQGVTEALAYDEHFAQAGFTPLLRDK
jgi:uncharacterized protein